MEMIGAAFGWFGLVLAPLLGVVIDDGVEGPEAGGEAWMVGLVIVAIAHGVDAVMTRGYALKGHHPGKPPVVRV